jgi:small multidrug resistance pump
MMKNWIYLLIAIVAEVIGTSGLKESDNFTKLWPSLLTIAAYGVAFFFLSLTLRTIPVGIAYAIWSGVGIVLIALVGWLRFGQHLDAPAILGMSLIVAGVVILNVFSKAVSH